MNTKTITITDLADVQPGDMVTAEYVPPTPSDDEFGATIIGQASAAYGGGLMIGGHDLRFGDGAACAFLRFVSATREVPAWEPPAELAAAFADNLARLWGSVSAGAVYKEDTRQLLGWLHDNGWLKDSPTDPVPVDPVLDETDKRDRIDSGGDRWWWSEVSETWKRGGSVYGSLAALDRHYGPLRFANEDDE